jgi:hypothetical protein
MFAAGMSYADLLDMLTGVASDVLRNGIPRLLTAMISGRSPRAAK